MALARYTGLHAAANLLASAPQANRGQENQNMDRESIEKLKFDSRLARRRGWVDAKAVAANLESLPDVVDKIAPPEELDETPDSAEESD